MNKSTKFHDIIEYILTRTTEELADITVIKTATEIKVSRSYIYEIFENELKMSPADYITFIKIGRAAELLVTKRDLQIKEISHKLGFSTPEYFTHVFRKYYAVTPSQYREFRFSHDNNGHSSHSLRKRKRP